MHICINGAKVASSGIYLYMDDEEITTLNFKIILYCESYISVPEMDECLHSIRLKK
jgi:hypothetical protein